MTPFDEAPSSQLWSSYSCLEVKHQTPPNPSFTPGFCAEHMSKLALHLALLCIVVQCLFTSGVFHACILHQYMIKTSYHR